MQIRVGDSKYGTSDYIFGPSVPIIPQIPKFCITTSSFSSKHTVPVIIDAQCAKFFLHNLWVRGVATKNNFQGEN